MSQMYCKTCGEEFVAGLTSRCPSCRGWHTTRTQARPTQGLTLVTQAGEVRPSPAQILTLILGEGTAQQVLAQSPDFKGCTPCCGARVEEGSCPNCGESNLPC